MKRSYVLVGGFDWSRRPQSSVWIAVPFFSTFIPFRPLAHCQMFVHVFRRDEAFATKTALVLGLHHVDLGLHVPIEVRLCNSFVIAQLAMELSYTWQKQTITNIVYREITLNQYGKKVYSGTGWFWFHDRISLHEGYSESLIHLENHNLKTD